MEIVENFLFAAVETTTWSGRMRIVVVVHDIDTNKDRRKPEKIMNNTMVKMVENRY